MSYWESVEKYLWRCYGWGESDPQKVREFVERNGLTQSSTAFLSQPPMWKRWSYPRELEYGADGLYRPVPPHMDHPMYFRNPKTKQMCLTYQPYKEASDIRQDVENWADKRGLSGKVYDSSFSWYFPGKTCLVIISRPDVLIKL